MKTPLSLLLLMAVTFCVTDRARAQEVRYDLTGTYADRVPTTSLTAPGEAFTFEFLVPESAKVLGYPYHYSVNAPIVSGSYRFNGITAPVSSGTYSWSVGSGYGSNGSVNLNTSVGAIRLGMGESGSLAVLPPDASGQSHFLTGNVSGLFINGISIDFTPASGDSFAAYPASPVSVVGTPVPVPEPSCLALAVVGLISWGGVTLARRRRG